MKRNRQIWKKATALFAAAAMTLTLTGCSGSDADAGNTASADNSSSGAGSTASANARDDLNLRIEDAFSTLDPHNLSLNADMLLCRQIYEPLYTLNDNAETIPMLAESYTVSEDGLTWTFSLRSGVTFHNGEELKASDVVYSYERCFNNAYMQEKVDAIESVSAPDDMTVELHLKYPFSPLIEKVASIGIINEAFAEENKDEQGFLGFNVCGTGAYTLKEVTPDVGVTLTAYSGYWGGEPPIKTVNMELIVDSTTALTAFEAGELDIIGVPSANWEDISSSGNYNTLSIPSNHCMYLIFNTELEPFNNQTLRQAIAYAINRDDIIQIVTDGLAVPATSLATPYMFGYTEDHTTYDYDPEKAKELLADAGYPDGLDIGSIKTMGGSNFERVIQVVQSQLSAIGITCTIEGLDGNSLVSDCITGNFTMADMGQNMSLDYDFIKTYFNEEYLNGLNMARYVDPEIERLFDAAASTSDNDERLSLYLEIENMTQEACAYIPLYNLMTTSAWNKDLNYSPQITGVYYKDLSWN